MLVVGDFSLDNFKRDIIIETRNEELKRILSLHPAYMALQYPLLFPYVTSRLVFVIMAFSVHQKNKKNHDYTRLLLFPVPL
jgi:hypothetical protein